VTTRFDARVGGRALSSRVASELDGRFGDDANLGGNPPGACFLCVVLGDKADQTSDLNL
jgi:hypothetical protein